MTKLKSQPQPQTKQVVTQDQAEKARRRARRWESFKDEAAMSLGAGVGIAATCVAVFGGLALIGALIGGSSE